METLGELNRHEPGRNDRRTCVYRSPTRSAFAPGDFGRAVEELWALVPDARYRTTRCTRSTPTGSSNSSSKAPMIHGSELQWPRALLLSDRPEGTMRLEVYEEDDVDAALARFEELRPQARRLENAASQAVERYLAHFAARDWDAMAKVVADDFYGRRSSASGERRRPTRSRCRNCKLRAVAELGFMQHDVDPHRDPWGAPRPRASLLHCPRSWPEALDTR